MKLNELIKHIPTRQYIRICERMEIVGMGYSTTESVKVHGNKTVGTFYIKNGVLEINVYQR